MKLKLEQDTCVMSNSGSAVSQVRCYQKFLGIKSQQTWCDVYRSTGDRLVRWIHILTVQWCRILQYAKNDLAVLQTLLSGQYSIVVITGVNVNQCWLTLFNLLTLRNCIFY